MVILIAGASHTGKTLLAQKLLETYGYPYFSIDHLKMGLIRSGQTELTPSDDNALTAYLWPILREMIRTAIENRQNLIVEGCYIPYNWSQDFPPSYLEHICCKWIIMSPQYIRSHFEDIRNHGSVIEARLDDSDLEPEALIRDNQRNLDACRQYGCDYILIEDNYALYPEQIFFGMEHAQKRP